MTPNGSLIDEIFREGARRMLAAALEAEVNGYLTERRTPPAHRHHRTDEYEELGNIQAELIHARVALNKLRTELEYTRHDGQATHR